MPAVFSEEALARLEAGLRAQRQQHERFRTPSDGHGAGTESEPVSEDADPAAGGEKPEIGKEGSVPSGSLSRRKGALLACALLLVIGGTMLGVLLKGQGSTHAVAVNTKGQPASATPDKQKPGSAARSATAPPSSPEQKVKQVEAQGPPAASGAPAQPDQQPAEPPAPPAAGAPALSSAKPPQAPPATAPSDAQPAKPPAPPPPSATPSNGHPGTPASANGAPAEAQGPPAASPPLPETKPAQAAAGAAAPKPNCDIAACRRAYRSFRVSDCTFQPRRGKRRRCNR